jgi:hypothetical protein
MVFALNQPKRSKLPLKIVLLSMYSFRRGFRSNSFVFNNFYLFHVSPVNTMFVVRFEVSTAVTEEFRLL